MRADRAIIGGAALLLLLALSPLGPLLESRLATHILGYYPLNVAGGAVIGAGLAQGRGVPWTAAPALLMATLTLAFWALPRWIDASLADDSVHAGGCSRYDHHGSGHGRCHCNSHLRDHA